MSNKDFNKGQSDAAKGLGPKNPNEFKHWKEREDYNAGYNSNKNK